jgi:hypothetical protein
MEPRDDDMLDRMWRRLRSLFVPSVAVTALWDSRGQQNPSETIHQLFDWERDRLFTLAKGLAAAAVAALTALLTAAFENKLDTKGYVVGMAASLVGLLLIWAAFILTGLRRLGEQYALAVRDYGS